MILRPAWILGPLLVAVIAGLAVGLGVHLLTVSGVAKPATVSTRFGMHGEAAWAAGTHPAPLIDGLADQTGKRFSLASLRGRSVAIAFFDSHCTQQCPLEGRALAAAEAGLPAAQRPVLVVVSVNPLDTPAGVAHAIRAWGLAGLAPWHWVIGSRSRLAPAWSAYRIYVGRALHGDIPHTEAVYLVDRRGDERSAYLYPFATRFVTEDLRALARAR